MIEDRFHMTIPCCAQKCAHSIAEERANRIAELIVDSRLIGKATVFRTGIIEESLSQEKFAGSASAGGPYTYRLR